MDKRRACFVSAMFSKSKDGFCYPTNLCEIASADPDTCIFLRGGPTENALVLLYDTLISGFQWM